MFARKQPQRDEQLPLELKKLADEYSDKLTVGRPQLRRIVDSNFHDPPIHCPKAGVVNVDVSQLEDFTEGEIRWLMAHAIAVSGMAPPLSLNGTATEHVLLLCVLPLILVGAILGNFPIFMIGVAIVVSIFVTYFVHVSRRQRLLSEGALRAAATCVDDNASVVSAFKKCSERITEGTSMTTE